VAPHLDRLMPAGRAADDRQVVKSTRSDDGRAAAGGQGRLRGPESEREAWAPGCSWCRRIARAARSRAP